MGKPEERRATTLSISLTPALADAVSERVRSGLYGSASELIREALRLLLRVEDAERAGNGADERDPTATRLSTAIGLMDLGAAIAAHKLHVRATDPAEEARRTRLDAAAEESETGPGLRLAPERLERLRRGD